MNTAYPSRCTFRAVFLAAALFLLSTADAQAQTPTFGAATNLSAGSVPVQLATGDVNNDGWVDIVVSEYAGNSLGVFLGSGDGSFQTRGLAFQTVEPHWE